MSLVWAADWRGEDEPRDVHPLSCLIWKSPEPADDCDCGGDAFEAGVQEQVDRFESYTDGSS